MVRHEADAQREMTSAEIGALAQGDPLYGCVESDDGREQIDAAIDAVEGVHVDPFTRVQIVDVDPVLARGCHEEVSVVALEGGFFECSPSVFDLVGRQGRVW